MTYKLLIADDEQMERDALRYIVARGCSQIGTVLDAANGREAVELAERERPEIVLLDIKMPGINGVEAAGRILELVPHARLVFLTAYDYFDYAQQAIRLGVVDFIIKPATNERVIEVINSLVAQLDDQHRSDREQVERERRLKQTHHALEEALVLGLVRGDLGPEQMRSQIEALELEGREGVAASIYVDFESYPMQVEGEAQRSVLRRRCVRELKTGFAQHGYDVLVAHCESIIHMLILRPLAEPAPSASVDALIDEGVQAIGRKLSITCMAGADCVVRPIPDASPGFRNALLARAASDADRPVVVASDPARAPASGVSGDEDTHRLEEGLWETVQAGNQERAVELSQILVHQLIDGGVDFRTIRRRVMELVIVLARELDLEPSELRRDGCLVLEEVEASGEPGELQHALREAIVALSGTGERRIREHSHRQIEKARQFIDAWFAQCLSLEDAAREARLSPYYFSRAFKLHTGYSFVDYLNSVRVAHAKRLLRGSSMSVKEIAAAVGFSDPNYFSRVFKQHVHLTPTQFRSKTLLH